MESLWDIINSPAFISVVAALLLYGLNRLYAKKPLWQQWEGTIITAIKLAEKAMKKRAATHPPRSRSNS